MGPASANPENHLSWWKLHRGRVSSAEIPKQKERDVAPFSTTIGSSVFCSAVFALYKRFYFLSEFLRPGEPILSRT